MPKFLLTIPDDLHDAAKIAARRRRPRITLHNYILEAIKVLATFDGETDELVKAALEDQKKD